MPPRLVRQFDCWAPRGAARPDLGGALEIQRIRGSFRGNRWECIRKPERQQYLLNAYRVLLTRARQGMVVFMPPGDRDDPTRLPEMYEGVFEYLASVGVPVLRAL